MIVNNFLLVETGKPLKDAEVYRKSIPTLTDAYLFACLYLRSKKNAKKTNGKIKDQDYSVNIYQGEDNVPQDLIATVYWTGESTFSISHIFNKTIEIDLTSISKV